MFGKFLILLLVPFELFLFLPADPTVNILFFAQPFKDPLYHAEILVVHDILGIYRIQVALTQRQVMYRVEEVGFPHTVFTHKTVDFPIQGDLKLFIILEIDQRKRFQMHIQNYYFLLLLRKFLKTNNNHLMAKKKSVKHGDKNLEGIEQALTRSEQFIEDNQKLLTYILIGIVLVLLIVIGGNRYYLKPLNEEAAANMFYAERFFEIDSFNLALNGYGTYPGFLDIMDDYGITKSARIARYYAGICYHQLGDYEAAIKYLDKFRTNDLLVGAAKYSTMGDAYVELGELEKATGAYQKGIDKYKNNYSSPIILKKLGIVYEEMGDLEGALDAYRTIELNYPDTPEGREIRKYIGRVESKMSL